MMIGLDQMLGITKVIAIQPEEDVNVCTSKHCSPTERKNNANQTVTPQGRLMDASLLDKCVKCLC